MKMSNPPLAVAYGLGVDSTAVLVELQRRQIRPDLILFADTKNEKDETYAYLPVIQEWLQAVHFPPVIVVENVVQKFKYWPAYDGLGENCLTNGTLPSLAFGFKKCSLKWKVAPQDKYCRTWQPAIDCWASRQKVRKIIGYDASPKDRKRFAHAVGMDDPLYSYEYPLIEWGWDRDRCKAEIAAAGLPVPPKSACYFCPATQPEELHNFKLKYLRYIVVMETRAAPQLTTIEGLWRNGVKGTRGGKKKPGRMTDYIREHQLLPADEIDRLTAETPLDLRKTPGPFSSGETIPNWHDFLEAFTPEDGVEEPTPGLNILQDACEGCTAN